jgi:hypothetical protein
MRDVLLYFLAIVLVLAVPGAVLILSGSTKEVAGEFFRLLKSQPVAAGITASVIVFAVSITVLNLFIPTTCRDGWHSLSIGRRGACSWHGGVTDNGKGILSVVFGVTAGFGIWFWRQRRQ